MTTAQALLPERVLFSDCIKTASTVTAAATINARAPTIAGISAWVELATVGPLDARTSIAAWFIWISFANYRNICGHTLGYADAGRGQEEGGSQAGA
jgi:hypothetical protein